MNFAVLLDLGAGSLGANLGCDSFATTLVWFSPELFN